MKVLICGDREWTEESPIRRVIGLLDRQTTIIEGEARGADKMAARVARERGYAVEPYPADWRRYGSGAGPIRNKQMLREGGPDYVVYFHRNVCESKGTANMIEQAEAAGVPVACGVCLADYSDGLVRFVDAFEVVCDVTTPHEETK